MRKFKIGDKVVRLAGSSSGKFSRLLGCKDYYSVIHTSLKGYWLQVDGVYDKYDPVPWNWASFKLYEGPEDEAHAACVEASQKLHEGFDVWTSRGLEPASA